MEVTPQILYTLTLLLCLYVSQYYDNIKVIYTILIQATEYS